MITCVLWDIDSRELVIDGHEGRRPEWSSTCTTNSRAFIIPLREFIKTTSQKYMESSFNIFLGSSFYDMFFYQLILAVSLLN